MGPLLVRLRSTCLAGGKVVAQGCIRDGHWAPREPEDHKRRKLPTKDGLENIQWTLIPFGAMVDFHSISSRDQ